MEQLRTSSYVISVKLEEEQDKYMLVHGYTGAIDIVNEKVANYLAQDQIVLQEEIPFSKSTLELLTTRGYLTDKTHDKEIEHVKRIANVLHKRNQATKNFTFIVAYDCNFRCPYCVEHKLSENGRQWSGKVFSKEMVDKAYDAMLKIEKERKLHFKRIVLYGGEPLLPQNKEIVQYIVNKGKALGYNFLAVTNGYELENFGELLSHDQISMIQITVDGAQEQHDKKRIHHTAKKTFDKIIKNISLALQKGINVNIRMNTDANNISDLKKLNQLFTDLGFFEYKNFSFYSALLFDYKSKEESWSSASCQTSESNNADSRNKGLDYMNLTEFHKFHKKENYQFRCKDHGTYDRLFNSITKNKPLRFSPIYCGAQANGYAFDPFGEMYGCLCNIGEKDHIIGEFKGETIQWTEVFKEWHKIHIGTSSCCSCKYALLCGGGCLAHAILRNGDISNPYCDNFDDTFKHSANKVYNKISARKLI